MKKYITKYFDSPSEFFEYARWDWKPNLNEYEKYTYTETEGGDPTFCGIQDDVYEKFIKHNFKNEVSIVDSIMNDINTQDFMEMKWQFVSGLEEGDDIDIGRYLDGHDRFWRGVRRRQTGKKTVRVYTHFGGIADRTVQELSVSGAIAVTITEMLESLGVGVELLSVNAADGVLGSNSVAAITKIKGANEFADLGLIGFIQGDAHVFRNTMFRNRVRIAHESKCQTCSTSVGRTANLTIEDLEGRSQSEADGVIVIPHIYKIDEAKRYIIDTINNLKEKTLG